MKTADEENLIGGFIFKIISIPKHTLLSRKRTPSPNKG